MHRSFLISIQLITYTSTHSQMVAQIATEIQENLQEKITINACFHSSVT